ncbi:MAG: NIF family HAD-type phosphatase [Planctomycetota bacterium]
MNSIRLLALDLEATLIDDAMTARPRPGLNAFLSFCNERFERLALLTTVDEPTARAVLDELAEHREIPGVVADRIEYIEWEGQYKDLRNANNVALDETLLVDDDQGWIHPEQFDRWVPIAPWRGGMDTELERVQSELASRLSGDG